MTSNADAKNRWLALYILCLGELMIVLDTTIVNVALPSIREDLAFTETSLVWVVNAYMLTYGGVFLPRGGLRGPFWGRPGFLPRAPPPPPPPPGGGGAGARGAPPG